MTDVISRQSVIEMLDETRRIAERNIDGAVLMTFERVLDSLVNITNALPAIQPEPHWIPVTERLPEVGKSVLICDAYGDICLGHRANYGYYFPDFCGDRVKNVTAWCNLPEPYKGVTE